MHFVVRRREAILFVLVKLAKCFLNSFQVSKGSCLLSLSPLKCQHTRDLAEMLQGSSTAHFPESNYCLFGRKIQLC